MTFQIKALDPAVYAPLFAMDDAALSTLNARRVIVDANTGFPCRVSLEDAHIGDEVILTNHTHQPAASAFQSAHAIYVRRNVAQAFLAPDTVPEMMQSRMASVRGFNGCNEICSADVVQGPALAATLIRMFTDPAVLYIHIHNAKLGCFTARADRA